MSTLEALHELRRMAYETRCCWCDNLAHTLLGTEKDPACHAHALQWGHTYGDALQVSA